MYPEQTIQLYPERIYPNATALQSIVSWCKSCIIAKKNIDRSKIGKIISLIERHSSVVKYASKDEIKNLALELRRKIRKHGFSEENISRSFAITREAAHRTLGIVHYDVQLVGGWFLLQGMVAEMETGEGKTLTATLPACAAALAGIPTHIISVNDYLVDRDMEWMKPIYDMLEISVGKIVHNMSLEERKNAYSKDVVYCTNKEIAFDYLKDRIKAGRTFSPLKLKVQKIYKEKSLYRRLLLRGLHFGIVDEADSVLIDEARTPLIISDKGTINIKQKELYEWALELASHFKENVDFTFAKSDREISICEEGVNKIHHSGDKFENLPTGLLGLESILNKALVAKYIYQKDKEYVVINGKVQIVDEYTGRIMEDRSWEQGLQQLIELKEGCELTSENETIARMSYQRFFRRYISLAGMTGTAREVAKELYCVYGLKTFSVPTNKPIQRHFLGSKVCSTIDEKWLMVTKSIIERNKKGIPVLIGTRSVKASEQIGNFLKKNGLLFRMLNAKQDKKEAEIIADAGKFGCITVATNMAGRGTDIKIDPEVRDIGGLHVIATERHDARRIDRQLFGRCGRQGDPGSYEEIISFNDEIIEHMVNNRLRAIIKYGLKKKWPIVAVLAGIIATLAQLRAERRHFQIRKDLLEIDQRNEKSLAISGLKE